MSKYNNQLSDFDPIFITEKNPKNSYTSCDNGEETGDLFQLSSKFYELINIKIAFLLFLTYYIFNTDIFIEKGLGRIFKNVYDSTHDRLTEKGIIISGIMLSLFYILYDMLDKKNII